MKRGKAFWDSSALVPLCFPERGSHSADRLANLYDPVVWWGTPVEIESAIARKRRTGLLSDKELRTTVELFAILHSKWRTIQPSEDVRQNAQLLVYKHDLGAADALQLAAALVWRGGNIKLNTIVCGDSRLSAAASANGFNVESTAT